MALRRETAMSHRSFIYSRRAKLSWKLLKNSLGITPGSKPSKDASEYIDIPLHV